MIKTISEVLKDFSEATTEEDRINVLRKNNTKTLRKVLNCVFNPDITFTVERWPNFKISDVPAGVTYSDLHREMDRLYLFVNNHPKRPQTLTEKRSEEILIQILEMMTEGDALVLLNMFNKNLKVSGLTKELVEKALPGFFAETI